MHKKPHQNERYCRRKSAIRSELILYRDGGFAVSNHPHRATDTREIK
jgi:hypothetical protein